MEMRRLALPLALLLAFALAAPAAAESRSATYKGEITHAAFTCHGESVTPTHPQEVLGDWTINLSNDRTATVTVHAWYDGAHHMSTGHGQYQVSPAGAIVTLELGIWTATLDQATNAFSWAADLSAYYTCPLAPGDPYGHEYDGLTYFGE
jgi:hypothetical protein